MTRFAGRCLFAAAVLAGSGLTARAGESTAAEVVDGAGLFRPETVTRANSLVRELRGQYRFDVRFETLAALPDEDRKKVEGVSHRRRTRYLGQFARRRAVEANLDGLYVLVCTDPATRFIEVTTYPSSTDGYFSRYKQKRLHEFLEKGLAGASQRPGRDAAARAGAGFGLAAPWPQDATLLGALNRVKAGLREQAGDPDAVRAWPVAVLLSGGVGLWLLLTLVRRKLAERNPDAGLPGPAVPDRAAALLASQFGTPAAYWVCDRLFFGQPGAAADAPPPPAPAEAEDVPAVEEGAETNDYLHADVDHADTAAQDGNG